jgi:hypothetical protein
MVKEILISDIELRLTGGTVSDDAPISRRQISHWLDVVRDRLVRAEIEETGEVNPEIWDSDMNLDITSEEIPNEEDPRFYVLLSKQPLSTINDRAIVKIETTDRQTIHKTTLAELTYVRRLHFAKPSLDNILYYRNGSKLYLEGCTARIADDFDIHAYYVSAYTKNPPAESEEFKISGGLIPTLLDMVEDTARRESQIKQDLENDGK